MGQKTALTNDTTDLQIQTGLDGPGLEFDFPALHLGIAEYPQGPTGCTVFYFPEPACAVVDVGSIEVGTVNTDLLRTSGRRVDAICLAGGSVYGLEAMAGVTAEFLSRRGYSMAHEDTPIVVGAITHDFDPRDNSIYPDKDLGRIALRAAKPGRFPLGPRGVGSSLSVGKGISMEHAERSGQGAAFRQIGPTKIAVFSSVNALGAIVDRNGRVVRGNRDPLTGTRYHLHERIGLPTARDGDLPWPGHQTTLSVLVINEKLEYDALQQLARQVHTSMARGIQPFQTLFDGDVLFAATTNEVSNPSLKSAAGQGDYNDLGVVAAEAAWDAILSCFSGAS